MTQENAIKQRMLFLEKEINAHNYKYYTLDLPTVSDFDFDKLLQELIDLEKQHPKWVSPNSPTQRVGGGITDGFVSVSHRHRMYSLDNCYEPETLIAFDKRIKKNLQADTVDYLCELKYDGASINLTYENGVLQSAVTRGDGFVGDDVTNNIKTIKSVPLKLNTDFKGLFEVRGEVMLPLAGFQKMNQERVAMGEPTYANPRNTASGSLKLLDSHQVAKRPLDCLIYSAVGENLPFNTQQQMLEMLYHWGFKVPQTYKHLVNIGEVLQFIDDFREKRTSLPFEIDGIVVKVNSMAYQERLGHTAKSPRWAIAYKYQAEQALTQLKSVQYQVGRTGAVTPVAELIAVSLSGSMVKRASLHNADIIEKLDLRLDDWVFVEKGGEIIPKITGVDLSKRNENQPKINFINHCPACQTPLVKDMDEAAHYCPNDKGCPPQIMGKIAHFSSRKAMNISSLGGETIRLLYEKGLVNNIADLYDLKTEDVLPLERMAEKSAQNLIDGITQSKQTPYEKLLYGLGIRFVGEIVAKKLAQHFKSIDILSRATYDDLIAVDEIGKAIAQSLQSYFDDAYNRQLISRLKAYGLRFSTVEQKLVSDSLEGKSFLFTGKLTQFTRQEAQLMVSQHGGKLLSNVSKKLNYLVAGENAGSKIKKVADFPDIQIISEDDFLKLIHTQQ